MRNFYIEDDVCHLKNNKFVTLNLEIYYLLSRNGDYRELVKDWSIVCDSRIIQYYLLVFYNRKVYLNQGHRLIYTFIKNGFCKFLFLGSNEENLNLSSLNIKRHYKNIIIDTDPLTVFNIDTIDHMALDLDSKYNYNNYDVIFVALGAPKQDILISHIETNSLIFGCGGTFEFISNKVSYPPKIIEYIGLTFAWRLCHDFTRRRFRKIMRTFMGALVLIIKRDIN